MHNERNRSLMTLLLQFEKQIGICIIYIYIYTILEASLTNISLFVPTQLELVMVTVRVRNGVMEQIGVLSPCLVSKLNTMSLHQTHQGDG